jgi:sterol-4alpha-carboxylate 3-dehydrogenase (decarboxylating)
MGCDPRLRTTPQDRQFFPVLIESARKGKTKYALGSGANVADFTFVGNVAHAHLLAAEKVCVWGGPGWGLAVL